MSDPHFWDNTSQTNKILRELKLLRTTVEPFEKCVKQLAESRELLLISAQDEEFLRHVEQELVILEKTVGDLEVLSFLGGPFDKNNAILSINSGAGGTESCDWANMLLRMYTRWCDDQDFTVQMIDTLPGEEAGIKNVTLRIEGDRVYGLLKCEKGVHRLVRISPFDSNKRRHTSFASVDVIPEIEDDIEVKIEPEELRIDIYRSSGPGGQSVNTTDSAVRITHLSTGIVVQCQNERSQLQNRQTAMKILKACLYARRRIEHDERMAKEYGEKQKIEWGSQIRSYVMHPYNMVKDHRTDIETGDVTAVMDGEIDMFIEAYLRVRPVERKR